MNRDNLDSQGKGLSDEGTAKGYMVKGGVKEGASGLNDKEPKWMKWRGNPEVTLIVVEQQERLSRCGLNDIGRWQVLVACRQEGKGAG